MTDKKKSVEQELIDATGVKPGKNRADFLKKLHGAVIALNDNDWDKLSDAAGKWANAGTKAIKEGDPIADFVDNKADASSAEEEDEEPVAEKKATPAKKPAATDKPKAAAPKKRVPGKIEKMKGIMLKNLSAKSDDLKAKLVAAGVEISDATITTVRSDFMSTLRVLKSAGKLTDDLAAKLD